MLIADASFTDSNNYNIFDILFSGVALPLRKIAAMQNPTVVVKDNEDGTYTVSTITTFKSHTVTFKLDVEQDEDTPDGRKVKVKVILFICETIYFLELPCQL